MTSTSLTPALPEDIQQQAWHTQTWQQVIETLAIDPEQGLTAEEVQQRQHQFGANRLTAKAGKSPLVKFLLQFNQPLLYILLIAGTVSLSLGKFTEAGVIYGVTVLNAIIGYVQESKAENAIAALAAAITTEATVLRDGKKMQVSSVDLVPGDVVLLSSGDKVPADLRLVQVRQLQISEAALTGESLPVQKQVAPLAEDTVLADRLNMAYSGSLVTFGQGRGVVVAIADATETGRLSQLIQQSPNLSTPLTRKFNQFSKTLLYIILGLAALTFAVGLGHGNSPDEVFNAAVALSVSAIPEGLPAVVTITLAIGVSRMAQRHTIIRKLPAVETLGGTTVICSDKTGTLTENQMTVQLIYAGGQHYSVSGVGYAPDGKVHDDGHPVTAAHNPALAACLQVGLLCNDAQLEAEGHQWLIVGDPTEGALITVAAKAGLDGETLNQQFPRLDTIPFESEFQYMATLHQEPEQPYLYAKGSVESILKRCQWQLNNQGQPVPVQRQTIEAEVTTMAAEGLRVLAFAHKPLPTGHDHTDHEDLDEGLIFLGLQGMIDPPRPEAIAAVSACQTAGIQVKMITGDHILTATEIARQMGLSETDAVVAYTGQDLANMEADDFSNAAEAAAVFARVAPEQKLRLVEALQAKGEIVAMTGDGVNDAPALKQADVGTAMGMAGTEVAKEAADIILTDDNFASIEAAVEEGRTVYQNLLKAISFILPVNGGESMTVLISVMLNRLLPILPVQILWLNMVNSVAMTVPVAFEPKPQQVMQRPPRRPSEPLLSASLVRRILAISVFNWIIIFGVFEWILQATANEDLARSMAINSLVAGRILYLLSICQLVPDLWARLRGQKQPIGGAIFYGIIGTIISQVIFTQWGLMNRIFETAPMSWEQWGICMALGVLMLPLALLLNRIEPIR
ncbi:HAD-IC family P-type ATPase [Synechococcales cyanobacterium C]|uniref:HAD-IC family P-type ATPase n=1 Tax=Petrachloros mirabilis ULC683 TaxID=2781853 RepID=A0A8K2A955_9CYAN|nr:HAD-IC family P-type ATPase [Petrachloros mirabilis]NCJ07884.1 HAD-IC family P-type ATPase [Petrachloros mirabilis ULC683]